MITNFYAPEYEYKLLRYIKKYIRPEKIQAERKDIMGTFLDIMGALGEGMVSMADAYADMKCADMKRMEELKKEYNTLAQKYGKETIGNTSTAVEAKLPEAMTFDSFPRADSFLEAAGYSYVKSDVWKKGDILARGDYKGCSYIISFYRM